MAQLYQKYTEDDGISLLNQYIKQITDHYFEEDKLLHLIFPDKTHDLEHFDDQTAVEIPGTLLNRYQFFTSNFNRGIQFPPQIIKPSYYIVYINRNMVPKYIYSKWNILKNYNESWNPSGRFIFAVLRTEEYICNDKQLSIDILNSLWQINIFKSVILITDFNGNNVTKLITALPYSRVKLCRNLSNVADLIISGTKRGTILKSNLFHFSFPTNFHGCPMIAKTVPYSPYTIRHINRKFNITEYTSGIEILLLRLFGQTYNISFIIKTPLDYDPDDVNFSRWPNELYSDIINHLIDFSFAGLPTSYTRYFLLESSHYHSFDDYSVFVPYPDYIEKWKIIYTTFPPLMWLALSLHFLSTVIVFILCYKLSYAKDKEYTIFNSIVHCFMTFFSISFKVSVPNTPKLASLMFIYIGWSLVCMNLTILYQLKMFTRLINPILEKNINSLERLRQSNLKLCMRTEFYNFTFQYFDINESYYFIPCDNIFQQMNHMMIYKNITLLEGKKHTLFLKNVYRYKFNRLNDGFYYFPVSIITGKGHITLSPLNKLIKKSIETGLLQKIERDMLFNFTKRVMFEEKEVSAGVKAFTMEDFQGPFIVLILGIFVSVLVFIFELIAGYFVGKNM